MYKYLHSRKYLIKDKYLHSRKYLIKDRQYICLGILQPDMLCPSASGKPAGNTGSVPAKRERASGHASLGARRSCASQLTLESEAAQRQGASPARRANP